MWMYVTYMWTFIATLFIIAPNWNPNAHQLAEQTAHGCNRDEPWQPTRQGTTWWYKAHQRLPRVRDGGIDWLQRGTTGLWGVMEHFTSWSWLHNCIQLPKLIKLNTKMSVLYVNNFKNPLIVPQFTEHRQVPKKAYTIPSSTSPPPSSHNDLSTFAQTAVDWGWVCEVFSVLRQANDSHWE